MNKVIIIGRLVRDPELKVCNSGTEVCSFTVAVDRRMKDANGEKATDFIDCTAWSKSGVFVNTYFRKGDGISVEGRMESRKWVDKDGNNRVSWGVSCDNVEFVPGKGSESGSDSAAPAQSGFSEVGGSDGGELPF